MIDPSVLSQIKKNVSELIKKKKTCPIKTMETFVSSSGVSNPKLCWEIVMITLGEFWSSVIAQVCENSYYTEIYIKKD